LFGHNSWEFFAHLARNTIMGGLASFIVWALASPEAGFGGRDVAVGTVASAIVVGGGGVSLVNKLFQQSAKLEYREQGVEIAEALMTAEAEPEDA
jgi:hypothetical protein